MSSIDIVTVGVTKQGWGPIQALTDLAVRALDARHVQIPEREPYPRWFNARGLVPTRRAKNGRHAVIIAGVPGQLRALLERPLWLGSYESVSAWVIDSFWDDRVPRSIQGARHLDHVWVADADDIQPWERMFPGGVGLLPWGADTLAARAHSHNAKDIDLLRTGRQPAAYDDDSATATEAERRGIAFHGRPAFGATEAESQANLRGALARAKGVLAFTNLVDSTTYTHPTKEYITGRWTDAAAHGAVCIGKRPGTATSREMIPDFARLEISHEALARGMSEIERWLESYSSSEATRIRAHAADVLDWRHRLAIIADTLGTGRTETLTRELTELASLPGKGNVPLQRG